MSAVQEYRIVIDLDKTTPQTKPKNDLYQGDKEANVVVLEMVRKGAPATLSGYTARGSMERSDGSQVPCEGAVEGNTVRITLNEHCYVYAGPYKLDIELDGNGMRRTVAQINGVVQQTAQGPTVNINESIVDVDAVIALYGEMKKAKDETVAATKAATTAATDANSAADRANDAAQSIEGMTVSASPGTAADAEITEQDGVKHIHFTLQTGATPDITFEVATGAPGTQVQVQQSGTPEAPNVLLTIPRGDTGAVDGIDYFAGTPSALGIAGPGKANGLARGDHVHPMPTAEQVGARPDNWMPTAEDVGALPVDGTAADSQKLGGVPAALYTKMDKLWENAAMQSAFAEQTLSIDLSGYSAVLIEFNYAAGSAIAASMIAFKKTSLNWNICMSMALTLNAFRYVGFTDAGLKFGGGMAVNPYGTIVQSDNYIIPMRVYGLKGVTV